MGNEQLTTNRKALTLNLDPKPYGTFAEIGAGQEVARHFFQAGGAAGTVAKTISAYDMKFSDAIYGKSPRYVSRERLKTMLRYEYALLRERLDAERGGQSLFFAFANTVATKKYGTNLDGDGWLGICFQTQTNGPVNQIILHCRLADPDILDQQEAVGILGVNLIYGAFYAYAEPEKLIGSLMDNLSPLRVEINVIHFSGPVFASLDNRLMNLQLVKQGHARAVLFNPEGDPIQPGESLYKKPLLVSRGSFRPITNVNLDMIRTAAAAFRERAGEDEQNPTIILEITMNNLLATGAVDHREFLVRIDSINGLGYHVLVSDYPEYHRLATYFRRYTRAQIGITMGINNLLEVFKEKYYEGLDGGILEGFGRLFKTNLKLYVYPMKRSSLANYRRFAGVHQLLEKTTVGDISMEDVITAENLYVDDHLRFLYQHLLRSGYLVALQDYDPGVMEISGTKVLKQMQSGDPAWKESVPAPVIGLLEERGGFSP